MKRYFQGRHIPRFNEGELVQSSLSKNKWIGIIKSIRIIKTKESGFNITCMVQPIFTVDGRPIRKAPIQRLNEYWLRLHDGKFFEKVVDMTKEKW
jgi:hypothetical protein